MSKLCKNMTEVREEIDRIDREIVPLLIERLGYIKQAGHIKQSRDAVRDNARVEDVVNKAKATAESIGGNTGYIDDIYRNLIEWSIQHEFGVWDTAHTDD